MSSGIGPERFYSRRITQAVIAWVAWLVAGVYAFQLHALPRNEGGLLSAFGAASPMIKAYVLGWLLGSVILFATVLVLVQKAHLVNDRGAKSGGHE